MKKILIYSVLLCGVFLFGNPDVQAQQTASSTAATSFSAKGASKSPTTVYNIANTPINIEKDISADKYFQEALSAFDQKNNLETARLIRLGAQDLIKEAPKDNPSPQRKLVEQRIGELYGLSLQVESGMVHDRDMLQNQFADADESLAHRYYESTNTLVEAGPDVFADRLLGLSTHLRNSKEYHNPAEKAQIARISDESADLADSIRKMKPGERELSPVLKSRLNRLMEDVKNLKLDE